MMVTVVPRLNLTFLSLLLLLLLLLLLHTFVFVSAMILNLFSLLSRDERKLQESENNCRLSEYNHMHGKSLVIYIA